MVANITYSGITSSFLQNAFEEFNILSQSGSLITLVNPDTGFRTTLTGSNFSGNFSNGTLTGTLTNLTIRDASNNPVIVFAGIEWPAQQFSDALDEFFETDADGTESFEGLFSLQPVNYNASASNIGATFFVTGVTQPVTIVGSSSGDILGGGDSNDTITTGNAAQFDGETVFGSLGSDTINLGGLGANRFFDLSYESLETTGIVANLNGNAGTLTVGKQGAGTDTVLNSGNALDFGLSIFGTEQNDTFNINPGAGNVVGVSGNAGDDTFNLTLNGTIILGYNGILLGSPLTGVAANLTTGVVSSDGFGGSDTINIQNGNGVLEFLATNLSDGVVGDANDNRLFGFGGNDTLLGGAGDDELFGGDGNDILNPGGGDLVDLVDAGAGNDIILAGSADTGSLEISHFDLRNTTGLNVSIDLAASETATITKGPLGTTAIIDADVAIEQGDGLFISGGNLADTFSLNLDQEGLVGLKGGRGNDTFNLNSTGAGDDAVVLLDYAQGLNSTDQPTQGLNVNLASGIIANDGFGGRDVVTGNYDFRVEVNGTSNGDIIAGSNRAELLDGQDGNDLIFADGPAATFYGAGVANQVYRLYQATLDRAPDAGGHVNWTSRIATGERTLQEVVDGFVGSPEFQNIYGATNNAQFVTLLYNNVLGNDPDAAGFARWTGDLANGDSRAQVVLGFSESPQFINETTAAATSYASQRTSSSWSDDVFRLYQATLDRAPDVTGQTNWSERLATGERTLVEVASGFVGSAEFQSAFGGTNDTEFVGLLYNNVLGTAPDAAGLARWTGELASGASRAEVVLGFSQSPQFTNETADDLESWMRDQGIQDTIIAGAGNNTVAGGQFADLFVFDTDDAAGFNNGANPSARAVTTVLDLEAWDVIALDGFNIDTAAEARSFLTQSGSTVVFDAQGVQVNFVNTTLADFTDDTFIF